MHYFNIAALAILTAQGLAVPLNTNSQDGVAGFHPDVLNARAVIYARGTDTNKENKDSSDSDETDESNENEDEAVGEEDGAEDENENEDTEDSGADKGNQNQNQSDSDNEESEPTNTLSSFFGFVDPAALIRRYDENDPLSKSWASSNRTTTGRGRPGKKGGPPNNLRKGCTAANGTQSATQASAPEASGCPKDVMNGHHHEQGRPQKNKLNKKPETNSKFVGEEPEDDTAKPTKTGGMKAHTKTAAMSRPTGASQKNTKGGARKPKNKGKKSKSN